MWNRAKRSGKQSNPSWRRELLQPLLISLAPITYAATMLEMHGELSFLVVVFLMIGTACLPLIIPAIIPAHMVSGTNASETDCSSRHPRPTASSPSHCENLTANPAFLLQALPLTSHLHGGSKKKSPTNRSSGPIWHLQLSRSSLPIAKPSAASTTSTPRMPPKPAATPFRPCAAKRLALSPRQTKNLVPYSPQSYLRGYPCLF